MLEEEAQRAINGLFSNLAAVLETRGLDHALWHHFATNHQHHIVDTSRNQRIANVKRVATGGTACGQVVHWDAG